VREQRPCQQSTMDQQSVTRFRRSGGESHRLPGPSCDLLLTKNANWDYFIVRSKATRWPASFDWLALLAVCQLIFSLISTHDFVIIVGEFIHGDVCQGCGTIGYTARRQWFFHCTTTPIQLGENLTLPYPVTNAWKTYSTYFNNGRCIFATVLRSAFWHIVQTANPYIDCAIADALSICNGIRVVGLTLKILGYAHFGKWPKLSARLRHQYATIQKRSGTSDLAWMNRRPNLARVLISSDAFATVADRNNHHDNITEIEDVDAWKRFTVSWSYPP